MDFTYMLNFTEDGVECGIVVDAWHHQSQDIIDVLLDECSGKGDVWTNIYALNPYDERIEEFDERLPAFLLAEKVKAAQEKSLIDQAVKKVEEATETQAEIATATPVKGKVRRMTRAVIDMFRTPFD
jgi:hypothetical protein